MKLFFLKSKNVKFLETNGDHLYTITNYIKKGLDFFEIK